MLVMTDEGIEVFSFMKEKFKKRLFEQLICNEFLTLKEINKIQIVVKKK